MNDQQYPPTAGSHPGPDHAPAPSAPLPATSPDGIDYRAEEQSTPFRELKKRHRSFVFPLAIAFFVWYFAYVLLAAYAREFMSTPVFGLVNVGLLLGLGQFVTTFGITMWYVSYANRRLDPLAADIRVDLAKKEASA